MRTYLVTGGAGFIGSNYIHYMFRKYGDTIRIINVDCLTYAGNLENLKDVENQPNYTFVKADICDSAAITKIFDENDIDRVVHFAAESHVDRSIKNPGVFCVDLVQHLVIPSLLYFWQVSEADWMKKPSRHRSAELRSCFCVQL